ncbi:unnamed protein product [Amoebophrya sp. A25]|nr:unnamed protein product [Amoebophrya sp. A25]|eukprot:GSA25T00022620001.1
MSFESTLEQGDVEMLDASSDEEVVEIAEEELLADKYRQLKERFGFFGDKYAPEELDELDWNRDVVDRARRILGDPNFPHLLLVGPAGSGKKTRVLALLRSLFGTAHVDNSSVVEEKINGVEVRYVTSPVHTELDVSGMVGSRDSKVVSHLLEAGEHNVAGFRVFVVYNAHLLSMDAQSALRRTMESVAKKGRKVFLVCQDAQGIIDPIQGRCTRLRLAAPDNATIVRILTTVAERERLDNLVDLKYNPETLSELFQSIAVESRGDMKKAIWMLQASFAKKRGQEKGVQLIVPEWVRLVQKIVTKMKEEDFNSNEALGKGEFPFETVIGYIENLLISVEPEELLLQLRRRFLSSIEFYASSLHGRIELLRKHCEVVQRVREGGQTPILHVLAFVGFSIGQLQEKKQKDDDRHMRRSLLEFYNQRKTEEADPALQERLRLRKEGLEKPKLTLL